MRNQWRQFNFKNPVHFTWEKAHYSADDLIHELQKGPFYFSFMIKEGFKQYQGGIYLNKTAKLYGAHSIKIIGYGYREQPNAEDPLDNWYWIG